MIGALFSTLKGWLLAAGGIALAVAVFFIRKSGADAERAKQAQADLKAEKVVRKARAEARGKSDEALDKEVDRWTRK